MKPDCAATIFHVSDVESSILYYTNVLGFAVEFRYNDFAGLELGPILIYLSGPAQGVKRIVGQGAIYIFCDEVDQYFREVSEKGAIIEVAIDNRDYGMRDFGVKDLDGNALSFGAKSEG